MSQEPGLGLTCLVIEPRAGRAFMIQVESYTCVSHQAKSKESMDWSDMQ